MLALKDVLIVAGVVLLATAVVITLYDLWKVLDYPRKLARIAAAGEPGADTPEELGPVRWQTAIALAVLACLPWLVAGSVVVIPAGMGGVRVSQVRGTLPGTLYSGAHLVTPLVENVEMFDLREKLFTAGVVEGAGALKTAAMAQPLDVQSKEGLDIGLATGWIRAGSTTSRATCRCRWIHRLCRLWWRAHGGIWRRNIRCERFSARNARRCGARRQAPSRRIWARTESLSRQ
jgi:hypothetical protein